MLSKNVTYVIVESNYLMAIYLYEPEILRKYFEKNNRAILKI